MKKLFLLLFMFISFGSAVFADIIPTSTHSINKYGIGVLNLIDSFSVYEKPDETSRVIKTVNYEELYQGAIINNSTNMGNTVVAYVPSQKVALVTVESNPETGWFEIYYDQKNGLTGWVQTNLSDFKTWRSAFYFWGKKNGVYLFRNIPEEKKRLYSQDSEMSQTLESFTYPKHIGFSIIRGNWMLVSILDIGKNNKIGWMRWREDDGKLLMFPNFK